MSTITKVKEIHEESFILRVETEENETYFVRTWPTRYHHTFTFYAKMPVVENHQCITPEVKKFKLRGYYEEGEELNDIIEKMISKL